MILSAVIVKNDKRRIKEILRTKNYYATNTEKDNNLSCEISFYKNVEAAKRIYPRPIIGIIYINIDTENIEFFGKDNVPVMLKSKFSETNSEYIFSFDEGIKDLHCKVDVSNYSF